MTSNQPGTLPSRARAVQRLQAFVPYAGRTYAAKRNFDLGPGAHRYVSNLSADIRHRLITESEVITAVLQSHTISVAEKFIQEVCWRTYWKGWLEQRPEAWTHYCDQLAGERDILRADDARAAEVAAAERGDTGIACFDAWAKELVATGYLHNHARMWFASIWIFTLQLPWVLGADFFYRHLLDGDPASNTLSWRWVGGLQTRGKTYLARADNIAAYTEGRHTPNRDDLAPFAQPLAEAGDFQRAPLPSSDVIPRDTRAIVLITEDDLSPESWPLATTEVVGVAMYKPDDIGPTPSRLVRAYKIGAMVDAQSRALALWGQPIQIVHTPSELATLARTHTATAVVTMRPPVGYIQTELARWQADPTMGVPILQLLRPWDQLFWPHAKAGFFQLKERIPAVFAKLNLSHPGLLP